MKTELHEGSRDTNSGKVQPHLLQAGFSPIVQDSAPSCRIHLCRGGLSGFCSPGHAGLNMDAPMPAYSRINPRRAPG